MTKKIKRIVVDPVDAFRRLLRKAFSDQDRVHAGAVLQLEYTLSQLEEPGYATSGAAVGEEPAATQAKLRGLMVLAGACEFQKLEMLSAMRDAGMDDAKILSLLADAEQRGRDLGQKLDVVVKTPEARTLYDAAVRFAEERAALMEDDDA